MVKRLGERIELSTIERGSTVCYKLFSCHNSIFHPSAGYMLLSFSLLSAFNASSARADGVSSAILLPDESFDCCFEYFAPFSILFYLIQKAIYSSLLLIKKS